MDLILIRDAISDFGCFGHMCFEDYSLAEFQTLEHAYGFSPSYAPKVPDGVYKCVRGMHRLVGMTADFETFEVTGVPEHSGILFHQGNVNDDSSGCILLGLSRDGIPSMIMQSHIAFVNFMNLQKDVNEFNLSIRTIYQL